MGFLDKLTGGETFLLCALLIIVVGSTISSVAYSFSRKRESEDLNNAGED
jgi:hypothetical protein